MKLHLSVQARYVPCSNFGSGQPDTLGTGMADGYIHPASITPGLQCSLCTLECSSEQHHAAHVCVHRRMSGHAPNKVTRPVRQAPWFRANYSHTMDASRLWTDWSCSIHAGISALKVAQRPTHPIATFVDRCAWAGLPLASMVLAIAGKHRAPKLPLKPVLVGSPPLSAYHSASSAAGGALSCTTAQLVVPAEIFWVTSAATACR